MQDNKFSIRQRVKSFQFAFSGLYQFFRTQHNAILHAAATGAAVIVSLLIKLPLSKFLLVILAVGLVWMAELFNTAIEHLCDIVHPQQHPGIKYIKDVAAAAVLVTAIVAVITACIIFIPEFL